MTDLVFNKDAFLRNVENLCSEFAAECTIHQHPGEILEWSHTVLDGNDVYSCFISQQSSDNVHFLHIRNARNILRGHFNTLELTFYVNELNTHKSLQKIMSMDKTIEAKLEGCFLRHTSSFRTLVDSEVEMPTPNFTASDMVCALNECFDKYSTFQAESGEGTDFNVLINHKGISIDIYYEEEDQKHTEIQVTVSYVQDKRSMYLYSCDYNFATMVITDVAGERPDGFDEGFAKFKLFGSLMN